MSTKHDGGSAFPSADMLAAEARSAGEARQMARGMTLRDYFAAKAMEGLIASSGGEKFGTAHPETNAAFAIAAFALADAMIEARKS